mgnify:CR=1 FL=1
MSYDPKTSRPDTDDSEHAAPVDSLLGSPPEPTPEPASVAAPAPAGGTAPLPEPVPTKRTVGAMVGAALAVVILFIGWRRRRR